MNEKMVLTFTIFFRMTHLNILSLKFLSFVGYFLNIKKFKLQQAFRLIEIKVTSPYVLI